MTDRQALNEEPPVIRRLIELLTEEHDSAVTLGAPSTSSGEGFDSQIHFVRLAGTTLEHDWKRDLVVRVKRTSDQHDLAIRERDIHQWLNDRSYPTPPILRVFAPGEMTDLPVQIILRAPGTMMLDAVKSRPWRAKSMIAMLASTHARLHRMDPTGFPGSGADLLDRRLSLTRETAVALDDAELTAALATVNATTSSLRDSPGVACHGDYHPLNVMVDGNNVAVIDWTDAGIGDLHGDVARTSLLFDLAAIAAGSRVERALLGRVGPRLGRWYLDAYRNINPVDDARLALWRPVHILHGWSQVRGLRAGLFDPEGERSNDAARLPPNLDDTLKTMFEQALSGLP